MELSRYLLQLTLGVILSGLIAGLGYRKHALAASGVLGAMLIGTIIFGLGGWVWGMVLITFFVLSSGLSAYKKAVKQTLAEKFEKGARRDLGQTLANGGLSALIALAALLWRSPTLFAAYLGAMATVNADTWATELGVLSRRQPRLITNGKVVEPGTSGGVSWLGLGATLAGGLCIGLAALAFLALDVRLGGPGASDAGMTWKLLPITMGGGLAGSLADSWLGATVQVIYFSTRRHKETERAIDLDGSPNTYLRGWRWLNNDWVNFLSSAVGALMAAGLWQLFNA
ncbi:MAG TPA: DUF92 domain-containing protein [Anaerolineae bacterium]|nr:DUF92 domain-containing protein [Anaerolineae bacterium]